MNARPICIAGAGSIGCFVGGALASAGRHVIMLARPRIITQIEQHGLRLSSFDGWNDLVAAERLGLSDDPAILAKAGTICVAVKSGDTRDMAGMLARYAAPDAVVVSLQNGVGNVATLQDQLPRHAVLGGMVPFNVIARSDAHVHRATSGDIVIARDAASTASTLSVPHLATRASDHIAGLQWGKLLLNLNNALNALSGEPLRSQLAQRAWRRLFADQMSEGLAVMRVAGIVPASTTPIPTWLTPHLLRWPDALFAAVLGRAMTIDADARSSMWEDMQRHRRTEIDFLQGMIVTLAERHGVAVPLTRRVVSLVKAAEIAGHGSPRLQPAEIRG